MVKPPKHDFPKFDGSASYLWIDRCGTYFELYRVPTHSWMTTASLYIKGHAAHWLQAFRQAHRTLNWPEFCTTIKEEFGPDEFELEMHKLLQLCQTGTTVVDYRVTFEGHMYHLLALDASLSPIFLSPSSCSAFAMICARRCTYRTPADLLSLAPIRVAVPPNGIVPPGSACGRQDLGSRPSTAGPVRVAAAAMAPAREKHGRRTTTRGHLAIARPCRPRPTRPRPSANRRSTSPTTAGPSSSSSPWATNLRRDPPQSTTRRPTSLS
ncbi:hypothetical protein D1007_52112 [Hordeum vulgare]|nr:hypothetical protein D1007_52112 [Hordeum vulgare]